MPDINNSLATQIQSPQIDIGGTLAKAVAIQKTQQEIEHNQFLYNQGGGFTPSELATRSSTKAQDIENLSRLGLRWKQDPSPENQQNLITEAGKIWPMDTLREQQLRSMPVQHFDHIVNGVLGAGQGVTPTIEQSGVPAGNRSRETGKYEPFPVPPGEPIISRTDAATGGRAPVKPSPAIVGDDEAVRKGLYSPTPEQTNRGVAGPKQTSPADAIGFDKEQGKTISAPGVVRENGAIHSTVNRETLAAQESFGKDYDQYKEQAKNAATTKYLLNNLREDAARVPTGKGATFTNTANQWLQGMQSIPGIGAVVKKITGDISDPVAAFEALQKNQGQLTRATLKDVGGTAASEYASIQKQLPNVEVSHRGINLTTAQIIAPYDYQQFKLAAADRWKGNHDGTLDGFETAFNKNFGPAVFLFGRLDPEEMSSLVSSMKKTDSGKATLEKIKSQADWLHKNGFDWILN